MGRPPRVLIADDEPALLDLYSVWLDDLNAEVIRAGCGAEALARCDDGVDVAILDRHMPRVTGDEVLDSLDERSTRPRVAFVTAATPDVRIVDLDIDGYLTKPVSREEYTDLVRSLLNRERLCDAADRYLTHLSKRSALLESESRTVLRSNPAYAAFEEELSRLAGRIDRTRLDDPFLGRALPDGGRAGEAFDPRV